MEYQEFMAKTIKKKFEKIDYIFLITILIINIMWGVYAHDSKLANEIGIVYLINILITTTYIIIRICK